MIKAVAAVALFFCLASLAASVPEAEAASGGGSGLLIRALEFLCEAIVWLALVPVRAVGWITNALI